LGIVASVPYISVKTHIDPVCSETGRHPERDHIVEAVRDAVALHELKHLFGEPGRVAELHGV
jgi:hypothetical protein